MPHTKLPSSTTFYNIQVHMLDLHNGYGQVALHLLKLTCMSFNYVLVLNEIPVLRGRVDHLP